jgi:predicted DNA-binding transcriptional regulator AlpA
MNRRRQNGRDDRAGELAIVRSVLREPDGQAAIEDVRGLLDAAGVARFLALAESTVRDMTYRRELPCVKVGLRAVRYQISDLIEWIERRKRPAAR